MELERLSTEACAFWKLPVAATALLAVTSANAKSPSDRKAKRFPQLMMETVPDQARPLAKDIMAISSVSSVGPYKVRLRSSVFADRVKRLLDDPRFKHLGSNASQRVRHPYPRATLDISG
jgi:hypothetical protein